MVKAHRLGHYVTYLSIFRVDMMFSKSLACKLSKKAPINACFLSSVDWIQALRPTLHRILRPLTGLEVSINAYPQDFYENILTSTHFQTSAEGIVPKSGPLSGV